MQVPDALSWNPRLGTEEDNLDFLQTKEGDHDGEPSMEIQIPTKEGKHQ